MKKIKIINGLLVLFMGMLVFSISCTDEFSAEQGLNPGASGASVIWTSPQNGSVLFTHTSVDITVAGTDIFSAKGGMAANGLSMAIENVDHSISNATVKFIPKDGWPQDSKITLSFWLTTSAGKISDEISFSVKPLNPGSFQETPFCDVEANVTPGSERIVFALDSGNNVKNLQIIDSDGSNLRPITGSQSCRNTSVEYGSDGWISFTSNCPSEIDGSTDYEIYRIKPDGTGRCQVTHNYLANGSPSLSPDAQKIAYTGGPRSIFTIDVNGTKVRNISPAHGKSNGASKWCGNGKIIYTRSGEIYAVNADGTENQAVSGTPAGVQGKLGCCTSGETTWAAYIYGGNIYTLDLGEALDGFSSGPVFLTAGLEPSFDHSCSKLVFTRKTEEGSQIFTILKDGSGLQQLTNIEGNKTSPSFGPRKL